MENKINKKIGITGQTGFVGSHLFNFLKLQEDVVVIPFSDDYFLDDIKLREFVKSCDVIVHLAAMNRHSDPQVIYDTNIQLTKKLIFALECERVTPHVLFASSIQESRDNLYGRSKLEGRKLLEEWSNMSGARFSGLVIPNVYGSFGCPFYNSFIATFCHQLTHNEKPKVEVDSFVNLIYVGSLIEFIYSEINKQTNILIERVDVPYDFEKKVSEILTLFELFKELYFNKGIIPPLKDNNEVNLFNTFRSYIDNKTHFPVKLIKYEDERGAFIETIKLGVGGQVSFSTTVPGITRGNHYHTRKIERFTVIKGKAQIQLRRIGSNEVIDFYLDGEDPSYVDMPIWYTHNITNVGDDVLYTQFWINEWYNPEDGDTYFETV